MIALDSHKKITTGRSTDLHLDSPANSQAKNRQQAVGLKHPTATLLYRSFTQHTEQQGI